jgi:1-acyl-sn-glycerol-3-phosphate acyltransferase
VFYAFLKLYARLAIRIYCRRIVINRPAVLKESGPLLLASNHPNSFLDGIILTTLFDQPVFSLARGDAFSNKMVDKLLRYLNLLPVYRTSEGVENLEHNYTTFSACRETFRKKGVVLIFSEGRCENEWHLRPLKKGTARLATTAWEQGIPLKVIPTAFNYSSFKNFGKDLHLYFGDAIPAINVMEEESHGKMLLAFNEQLREQLGKMVYEIPPGEKKQVRKKFGIGIRPSFYLLALPAFAGWLLHAPFFYAVKFFVWKKFRASGHFDSVMTALLMLLYPLYLAIMAILAGIFISALAAPVAMVLLPFTAWCCVQAKFQAGI